jgi:hypothetical protein
VRDELAAAVGVGVGAAVVFGAMLWFLERGTRPALRLARHGRTGTATIVAVRAARAGRTRRDVAEYEFRADDGEQAGSSTFRTAVPPGLGPGATATVLFDPEQPDRSELAARLREIVRFPPAMRADRT